MRRFRLRPVLLAGALAMTPPAAFAGPLEPGRPVEDRLAGAPSMRFALPGGADDYVRGSLAAGEGARFFLDLVDRDGKPVRRLLDGTDSGGEFHFVIPGEGAALLIGAAGGEGPFRLLLDRIVVEKDQIPPPAAHVSPRIAALARTLQDGGSTEAFWAEVEAAGAPLVEPAGNGRSIVTFLARGARRNVRLLGAPSGDHENLERLGGSDVWFRSFIVSDSTRLSYQLAPDVPDFPGTARDRRLAILATARVDPLNRDPWPAVAVDAYAQSATIALPAAPPQPWNGDRGRPRGALETFSFESAALGNRRDVTLYRPPGFNPADPRTLLLFVFDAKDYLGRVETPFILDNMIAEGVLPPVVAVFVANPDRETRARELPGNAVFADVLADDLLPLVAERAGLAPDPARTALAGSSYGGLAAATVALRRPDRFGNAISLSGSFWWSPPGAPPERPEHVAALVAGQPRRPVRFFLSAGLYEIAAGGSGGILETSRHLRDVLEAKDYEAIYREYAGGHDYLVWRGALADGLAALFGRR